MEPLVLGTQGLMSWFLNGVSSTWGRAIPVRVVLSCTFQDKSTHGSQPPNLSITPHSP